MSNEVIINGVKLSPEQSRALESSVEGYYMELVSHDVQGSTRAKRRLDPGLKNPIRELRVLLHGHVLADDYWLDGK